MIVGVCYPLKAVTFFAADLDADVDIPGPNVRDFVSETAVADELIQEVRCLNIVRLMESAVLCASDRVENEKIGHRKLLLRRKRVIELKLNPNTFRELPNIICGDHFRSPCVPPTMFQGSDPLGFDRSWPFRSDVVAEQMSDGGTESTFIPQRTLRCRSLVRLSTRGALH